MWPPDEFTPDWTTVATLAAVFVVVASATGVGTYSMLSDREDTSAALSISANVDSGQVEVTRIACTPRITSDSGAAVDIDNVEILGSENVDDTNKCARIAFWFDTSAFDRVDRSPDDAIIIHRHQGQWWGLDTQVVRVTDGMVKLVAFTDTFSPFAAVVPAESKPPISVQGNQTATNGTAANETPTNGTTIGGTTTNGTAANETPTDGPTTNGTATNGTVTDGNRTENPSQADDDPETGATGNTSTQPSSAAGGSDDSADSGGSDEIEDSEDRKVVDDPAESENSESGNESTEPTNSEGSEDEDEMKGEDAKDGDDAKDGEGGEDAKDGED